MLKDTAKVQWTRFVCVCVFLIFIVKTSVFRPNHLPRLNNYDSNASIKRTVKVMTS